MAVRRGDVYVVNGRKRWTSRFQHADAMLLLARTSPYDGQRRTDGLSLFFVDLRTVKPGTIDVEPIHVWMNNETNEITIRDLEIPADHRIGAGTAEEQVRGAGAVGAVVRIARPARIGGVAEAVGRLHHQRGREGVMVVGRVEGDGLQAREGPQRVDGVEGRVQAARRVTGARVEGYVHLRVEDLHLDSDPPQIHITHGKGQSSRYAPLLPGFAQELQTHLHGRRHTVHDLGHYRFRLRL